MSTVTLEYSPSLLGHLGETAAGAPVQARRLVVDDKCAVAAYSLAAASRHGRRALGGNGTTPAAIGLSGLSKPTFVRCSCRDLLDGHLDQLDPNTIVLEIADALGGDTDTLDHTVLENARSKGFRLAFDARLLKKEYASFVPLASYLILEMGVLELDRAAGLAQIIHSHTKALALASQVRTTAQFERLASAGVKLFEGLWFAQPSGRSDGSARLSYAALIGLMNLVARDGEVTEVEEVLKREPTLAFQLLRHMNSAAFGLNIEITSFRHAVMVMGMKRLFRWTALLVADTAPGSVAPAAGTMAIVRGRLMELLAAEALEPSEADLAFVTGMFSMLDTLMDMPLKEALELVKLPRAVPDALLHNNGPFAGYLAAAKACESADDMALEILSERLRIPAQRIVAMHLQALAWGEQFGR